VTDRDLSGAELARRFFTDVVEPLLLDAQRERGQPAPASAVIPFFDRPYRTVDRAVPDALLAAITDPDVARLPPLVGAVEQWADSTDVLSSPGRRAALQAVYRAWMSDPGAQWQD
jgi:hypothetical protein